MTDSSICLGNEALWIIEAKSFLFFRLIIYFLFPHSVVKHIWFAGYEVHILRQNLEARSLQCGGGKEVGGRTAM